MTPSAKSLRLYVLLVFSVLVLGACSAPQIKVDMTSTATLNMDINNQPLPVVVKLFQLSDKKAFENATFEELWKNDMVILSDSLLQKQMFTLDPASHHKVIFEKNDQAKFLGIMAAFHDQQDNSWKLTKKIDKSFLWIDISSKIKVLLKDNSIEIKE